MTLLDIKLILRKSRAISASNKKSVIAQLWDILRLRLGFSKLGADDYYLYKLYNDELYSFEDKKEFIGWRAANKIDLALNSDKWRIFANDKIQFDKAMSDAELRIPKIVSLFVNSTAPIFNATTLGTIEEVRAFFLCKDNYPTFIKPVHGTYGRGCFSLISVCVESESVQIGDGSVMSVSDIIRQIQQSWAEGYLIQELLTPHPKIATIVGNRLSSLRIIVIQSNGTPQIFRAVWKLPTGQNMSDNFMHGELGNLIANVDPKNGIVTNVIGKINGELVNVESHPDTGAHLSKLTIPLWPKIVEYCTKASLLFPGLSMQHWDIAICPEGPVALEVNVEGSLDLHQIAGRKGVYDSVLKDIFAQHEVTS